MNNPCLAVSQGGFETEMIRMHMKVIWKWLLEADKSSRWPLAPVGFSPRERRITSQIGVHSITILGREVVDKIQGSGKSSLENVAQTLKFKVLGSLHKGIWLRPEVKIASPSSQPKEKPLYLQKEPNLLCGHPVHLPPVQGRLPQGGRSWNRRRWQVSPPAGAGSSAAGQCSGQAVLGSQQRRRGLLLPQPRSIQEN